MAYQLCMDVNSIYPSTITPVHYFTKHINKNQLSHIFLGITTNNNIKSLKLLIDIYNIRWIHWQIVRIKIKSISFIFDNEIAWTKIAEYMEDQRDIVAIWLLNKNIYNYLLKSDIFSKCDLKDYRNYYIYKFLKIININFKNEYLWYLEPFKRYELRIFPDKPYFISIKGFDINKNKITQIYKPKSYYGFTKKKKTIINKNIKFTVKRIKYNYQSRK